MKLLYIAERELLNEQAMPLTCDIYKAMKNGPVLTTILEMIKDRHWQASDWRKWIKTTGVHVALVTLPAFDHLAPIVVDKLHEVHARYQDTDTWALVDATHEFPEWIKNFSGEGATLIPLEDIVADPEVVEVIREEEAARREIEEIRERTRRRDSSQSEGKSRVNHHLAEALGCPERRESLE